MTDINKAIAFAKECLKWAKAKEGATELDCFCVSAGFDELTPLNFHEYLESFLGNRFFIQINRGTSSLFKWTVIVGLQDRAGGTPKVSEHGRGDGDDMLDAIFDACVAAARLYPTA